MPIIDYFSLWTDVPAFGSKSAITKMRQPLLYVGVLIGALAKVIYDSLANGQGLAWAALIMAAIASVVIFPSVYYGSGLSRARLNWAKWCVAFQHGFFWQVLIEEIGKHVSAGGA